MLDKGSIELIKFEIPVCTRVAAILRSLPFDSHRCTHTLLYISRVRIAGIERAREGETQSSLPFRRYHLAVEVEPKAPGELPPNFRTTSASWASLIPQSSSNDSASRHVITMGLLGMGGCRQSLIDFLQSLDDLSLGLRALLKFRRFFDSFSFFLEDDGNMNCFPTMKQRISPLFLPREANVASKEKLLFKEEE